MLYDLPPALDMALLQQAQTGAPPLSATTVARFFLRGLESLQLASCTECPLGSQVLEACSIVADTVCDFAGCTGREYNPSVALRKHSTVHGNAVPGADCNSPRLDSEGGWCAQPQNNVPNEWSQIELPFPMPVAHIITQTRKTAPSQRFVRFRVQFGDSESSLQFVDNGKVFVGNTADDANAKVVNRFDKVVSARIWRIIPTEINGHMSGRWGLGVCPNSQSCVPVVLNPEDARRKYSTVHENVNYRASVLDQERGWLASQPNNVPNEWLLIDLSKAERIGAVFVQPRKDAPSHRVVKFRVQYSNDDITYLNVDNGRIFDGNQFDRDETVIAEFTTPVRARFWRLIPTQINGHMAMRWAVGQCATQ